MGYSCQSVHATNHNMTREDEQGLEGRFGGLLGLNGLRISPAAAGNH